MIEEFAHVWPRGGLFAFSGADGPADPARRLCLRGTSAGVGWIACAPFDVTFAAKLGTERLHAEGHPEDVCFPDCWRFCAQAGDYHGLVEGVFLDQATFALQITAEGVPMRRWPVLEASAEGEQDGDCTVYRAGGRSLVLCSHAQQDTRRFALCLGGGSAQEAVERARCACATGLGPMVGDRLQSYRDAFEPETLAGTVRRTYYKSLGLQRAVLDRPADGETGWRAASSCVAAPSLWRYDTAFQALALHRTRPEIAEALVLAALGAWPEGGQAPSAPPLLGWALWRQFEHGGHDEALRQAYPLLRPYLDWYDRHRKRPNGLYGWNLALDGAGGALRGRESGMAGSPRFDEATSITAADLCGYMASEFLCCEKMAGRLGLSGEAAEWRRRRISLAEVMNELLWDDADRFYYDLDQYDELIPVKTVAGLVPLLGLVPDRDQAEGLRGHIMNPMVFNTPMPLPSVSIDEAAFTPRRWRGAVAPEASVLVYHGLMAYGFFQEAREQAHRTLDEIARCYVLYGCVFECYDPMKEHAPHELAQHCAMGAASSHQVAQCQADFPRTAAAFVHLVQEIM